MQFSHYLNLQGLPSLSQKLRRRWIFTELLGCNVPQPHEEIDDKAALLLWFGDLLEHVRFPVEIIQQILRHVASDPPTPQATRIAAILDGRYFVYTNVTQIVDLETGETYETIPAPPMENIAYDLNELLRRRMQEVKNADTAATSMD